MVSQHAGGGKADGAGLIAKHAVAEYGAVYGEYTTREEIPGLLGGSIGAGRPAVAIRRLLLDRAEAYVLVAADTLDVSCVPSIRRPPFFVTPAGPDPAHTTGPAPGPESRPSPGPGQAPTTLREDEGRPEHGRGTTGQVP
jgi:hypothetical protein